MIKRLSILAVLMILFLALLNPVLAQVQGQIAVSNSSAKMDFPLNLNFSAQIKSNVNITDIRLRYRIEQLTFAQVTAEVFISFAPSSSVNAKYTLDMRKIGGVPSGTYVDFWWAVKDAAGARLETGPTRYQVIDTRYQWKNLNQGKVNLFWYAGDSNFAQSLMSAAQEALVKLERNTGASPDKMINIYIYSGAQDLQGAMVFPQEWTGGVAYTQYDIVAIGIPTNQLAWGREAMTHELTHIVISQVTANPYGDLPVWLNEGLAMYNQGPLGPQFTTPLYGAVSKNTLISVRSISSPFSANADKANLAYAESFTLIDFLISQYGPEKMLQLLNTFEQGSDYDPAFQKVYGFDMDGLNERWKPWINQLYGN